MRYTFTVNERLKREQHINTLFHTGKAYSVFPVKVLYLAMPCLPGNDSPAMAAFSVPKKKLKRSVDRHRTRRLMVEAWRLNKHLLYEKIPGGLQLHIFFIYQDNKLTTFDLVQTAVTGLIEKLREQVQPPLAV